MKFSEKDFIGLLFRLLNQRGIRQVDEYKSKRKLYYYKQDGFYSEIFGDIELSQVSLEKEVNISRALYFEKFFSGHVTFSQNNPYLLNIDYHDDFDKIKQVMSHLSEDGQRQMLVLADSLSKSLKVEAENPLLDFYHVSPNRIYRIYKGIVSILEQSRTLITDGNISVIDRSLATNYVTDKVPDLLEGVTRDVLVSDAKFVATPRRVDSTLQECPIYTLTEDALYLKEMSKEALKEVDSESLIRKINLK